MSYENFIHHRDALSICQFARAAAAHEAQGPPDDHKCVEDCPDCAGNGFQPDSQVECLRCGGEGKLYLHRWNTLPGKANDGTIFGKCVNCGVTKEL